MKTNKDSRRCVKIKWLTTASLILVAALVFACARLHAEPIPQTPSPLWQKAVKYMSQVHWIPGNIIEDERTYSRKGRLVEETRVELGISPRKNDGARLKLFSAEQNGKDISKHVRSDIEKDLTFDELIEDSPFVPKDGQQVTTSLNGKRREINNHQCTGFTYSMHTKKHTLEGTVWLDEDTGLPVEIHSTITSVPFVEEEVTITAYKSTNYFTITPQGDCLLKRSQEEMDVKVPGIGFKGSVIVESVAKNHWKYTPAP